MSEAAPQHTSSPAAPSDRPPSLWGWVLKFAAAVGLTGMICCVAPAVLFLLGLMSATYAMSFADFFYNENDTASVGAWVLRLLAAAIGVAGILLYRRKQNQCSIDSNRKRLNLILATCLIAGLGLGLYFTFEHLTGWYFNKYIVPAREAEYRAADEPG